MVVSLFLRRTTPTIAAGVTVPLSLAGTFAAMWACGISLDNLSLMALAVSVGFVVDDAIVMIENIFANLEAGMKPMQAALEGARQIGFTVISISASLLAAFIPLFFLGGIAGRFFASFSLTLGFTIVISTVVSLTLTPMICAHRLRAHDAPKAVTDEGGGGLLQRITGFYGCSLKSVLHHQVAAVLAIVACIGLTGYLYAKIPKGFLPQDDTGLIQGGTEASTDISYPAMVVLHRQAEAVVRRDPAVLGVGSSTGGGGFGSVNRGQFTISLKPPSERPATDVVIERMRKELAVIPGINSYLFSPSDVRIGARSAPSPFQFTLWDEDFKELTEWAPKVLDALRKEPMLTDVNSDRMPNGLQATVNINRDEAARLGVSIQAIDNALNSAFAQRQVSTIYTQRNQYRVILEVDPRHARDPNDVSGLYVPGRDGQLVPLTSVATVERTLAPLVVNHQGQFPSVTMSYNVKLGGTLQDANDAVLHAVGELHMPASLHTEFAGDAGTADSASSQVMLLIAAILTVYIVLGILYESLAHPLTIISTLPSAGLGALLALMISGSELTIIAFIGIILLIGIVKKNGIMLVDFALQAERTLGMPPEEAIYQACLQRLRPILMTTLAAIMGALPLIIATGPGSELRRPLGITIVGGLVISQILTLYTTPIIYMILSKLHNRRAARKGLVLAPGE